MTTTKRDILMTIALPYANGLIHFGHLIEAIQADIWARFQRARGNHVVFICGSDAHGTAVMLEADKQHITPDELVAKVRTDHASDLANFSVQFDNFYTTHSEENRALANDMYQRLKARGDITTKKISQAYDPDANMFLADRFIKGECPRCSAPDQYGDNCEACGATYSPTDLKNPKSTISGSTPVEKESEHYFFNLENYTDFLKEWMHQGEHLQTHVTNKLDEWFNDGLKPWDISRDAPYFGFEIPDAPGKYFYVWLDAPIGYMASLKNLANNNQHIDYDHYWRKDSPTELYHFIGKDIMYFHSLFWPAMLHGAGFRTPSAVFVHGFLTVNGQKMSKSRGTFITAKKYLQNLNPEYLRYYFAAKLSNKIEDIDLNLEDFMLRVNADLVGKYVNLASRCAGFISKKFDGQLANQLHDKNLFDTLVNAGDTIAKHIEDLNYSTAVRDIMALADRANQYIDQHKPWALAKEDGQESEVQLICTQGLNLFKTLSTYLAPILPETTKKVCDFLNIDSLDWYQLNQPLLNHKINKFKPLLQRITPEQIDELQKTDN